MQQAHDMAVTDKSVYLDSGSGNYLNLFNDGKIAMLWTGPWDLSSINDDVDYGVQVLPGDTSHASISGPDSWMIFDNGAQKVATAKAFVQFMLSPEEHLKFAIATGDLPVRESETKAPGYAEYLKKYPGGKVFVDNQANVTQVRPNITAYPEISAAIGQAVQAVMAGKAQPADALKTAADTTDGLLAGSQ
nr:extracellular solute-binding protein [Angustibacter aerolatus]